MRRHAPGCCHWSGWNATATMPNFYGQFLWTGMAHFRSGRSEQVFYYCNIVLPKPSILKEHPLYGLIGAREFYNKVVQLAEAGFLFAWKSGRKARPVTRVEWERWPRDE